MKPLLLLSAALYALTMAAPAVAQPPPRWEIGIGVAALDLPYYRGAADGETYLLPFPHLIYRGDRLNIDEGEIHGRLFRSPRLRLELSLAGGVPVASDGDGPRAGMPDLDPTAELGPELDIALWRDPRARHSLRFKLPVRAVFSVGDAGINHRGWVAAPYIEYRLTRRAPQPWTVGFALGPLYGDDSYHGYFYDVAPDLATAARPAYRAPGGYSGARATLTARRNFGRYWIGAFLRYDTLADAAFEDSPLVQTRRYRAFGVAVAWVLAQSEQSAAGDQE